MGIQGLTKLLSDNAPGCIKETKFEQYFGRKIAVDASNHIYQYLSVVGRQGDQVKGPNAVRNLNFSQHKSLLLMLGPH
jgi:hypothetical protein